MLAGGTAGTLTGLIFVVIAFGMDHAGEGKKEARQPDQAATPLQAWPAARL
jgi:hypothetical protein